MGDPREEVGVNKEFQKEAGDEWVRVGCTRVTMEGERLTKRADALGEESRRRRRGRPRLRWENYVNRTLTGAGRENECAR